MVAVGALYTVGAVVTAPVAALENNRQFAPSITPTREADPNVLPVPR